MTLVHPPACASVHPILALNTRRDEDGVVGNSTIYRLDDRYRGVKGGRRVIFVNPGGRLQERRANDFLVVAYSTPVGNAAAYYPETNPLVPLDHTAAKSNTPVFKAVVIRLEPVWAG
jgi:hypothetical protein